MVDELTMGNYIVDCMRQVIVRVIGIEPRGCKVQNLGGEGKYALRAAEMLPVPLSERILQRNGWRATNDEALLFPEMGEHSDVYYLNGSHYGEPVRLEYDLVSFQLKVGEPNGNFRWARFRLNSVHELQNALKAIDFKELADNFKI